MKLSRRKPRPRFNKVMRLLRPDKAELIRLRSAAAVVRLRNALRYNSSYFDKPTTYRHEGLSFYRQLQVDTPRSTAIPIRICFS